ncbi:MAG: excisionase family DNA-binding protein [Nitrospirae bacterium]|nr:excisionase family DNA-binding protein [Nitrospirota bacterium]
MKIKSERLMTVEEAAVRLGLKEATIRRRILEKRIGYVKVGRAVRIPVEIVEEIIAAGYREPLVR